MENSFSIYAPIAINKGVDAKGNGKMIVAGIASTTHQDFDGEFMNPKGFDLSYFKDYGFINWAHQTNNDPLSIIGRPSKVTVDTKINELFIESTLFKSSEKARQVYKLGEILEAEGLALAYSIEGKVTERDEKDPRKVLKAKITGCAITPTPKNNQSVAKIVKGLDDNEFGFVKGMLSAFEDEDDDTQKKAMGTESVAPITKESLDKKTKVTVEKLTKGQVMTILKEDLPNTSEEVMEGIYELTVTIEKSVSMKTPEVSPEALSKAYATLGIKKGVETPEAEVASEATPKTEEPTSAPAPAATPKPKPTPAPAVEQPEEVSEVDAEVVEASMEILKSVGYVVTKPGESAPAATPAPAKEDAVSKAVPSKEEAPDFTAILTDQLGAFSKGIDDKFGAVATLFKGVADAVTELQSDNKELREQVKVFGESSNGIRSVQAKAHIEKSIDQEDDLSKANGTTVLSASMHKNEILTKGDNLSGLSKGNITDMQLAQAVAHFEGTNEIQPNLMKALSDNGITIVG